MTWQDDLSDNGIMMREVDVANALIEGVEEKAAIVGITPTISISALDGCGFCSSLDANITTIAPSFIDNNNSAYSSDLSSLCSAAGYETVVYGATPGSVILQNGGVQFNAAYVAQRKDILALFINHEAITLPSTITLYSDYILVYYPESIHMVIDPADAYDGVTWSSSNTEVATIDSSGHVTVHADGSTSITATCDRNSNISGTLNGDHNGLISCFLGEPNVLHKLIQTSQASYTQNGLTLTHNADGTLTLNGTSTASNTSYQRFVIWPIGNTKTAWNLCLTNHARSKKLLWWRPISGTFDKEASTLMQGGSKKWCEIYTMIKSEEKMKITSFNDYSGHSGRFTAIGNYYDYNDTWTAVVFGIQVTKGTVIDHFTFEVGLRAIPHASYVYRDGGVLEEYLPQVYDVYLSSTVKIMRQLDKSFNLYLSDSASHSIRLTSSMAVADSSSSLMTGETIGIIGHTYKLTFIITYGVINEKANTDLECYVKGANNTNIAQIKVIDDPGVITDNVSYTDTTYETTFTLDQYIDMVGIYISNLNPTDWVDFAVKLEDITE